MWLCSGEMVAQINPIFKSKVDLVELSFIVEGGRGRYVRDLKLPDVRISRDGISRGICGVCRGQQAVDARFG
jgi:hypothetical protein